MWPALVAAGAVAALHSALPDQLAFVGHRWILASVVILLAVPLEIFHRLGKHNYCRYLTNLVLGIIVLALIWSVYQLVVAILWTQEVRGRQLIISAGILWLTNIGVFAVCYWRIDAGGPHKRAQRDSHTDGAFLFPQMTIEDEDSDEPNWSPNFVDYLFLAFNTSTALSPTDSPVLRRRAKCLMMLQALIALVIIAVLASRAVNIL